MPRLARRLLRARLAGGGGLAAAAAWRAAEWETRERRIEWEARRHKRRLGGGGQSCTASENFAHPPSRGSLNVVVIVVAACAAREPGQGLRSSCRNSAAHDGRAGPASEAPPSPRRRHRLASSWQHFRPAASCFRRLSAVPLEGRLWPMATLQRESHGKPAGPRGAPQSQAGPTLLLPLLLAARRKLSTPTASGRRRISFVHSAGRAAALATLAGS